MSEYLVPAPPDRGRERDRAADVAEITSIVGNTRRLVLVSGGLLTADIVGIAIAIWGLLGHGHSVVLGSSALLAPVIASWLAAAALLVGAEQPAASALGELRRDTGAPTDLSAPWRPLGVRPLVGTDLEWGRIASFIGAATVAHSRARLALCWAVIATAGFLLWTALSLAIAAVA